MNIKKKKVLFGIIILVLISFFWQNTTEVLADITQETRQADNYWINNKGYVDRIVFKVIPSDELMIQSLRNGEIDIVGKSVNVSLITQSDLTDPNIRLTQTRGRGFGHLTFNSGIFPTNIRGLRQGFAYAFDKEELLMRCLGDTYALIEVKLQLGCYSGFSFIADSPIVASQGIWSCEHELANCEFPRGETYFESHPGLAIETVLAQGWYDYDNDGWREFYNGTVSEGGEIVWDGGNVYHQHGTATYDENYNGYTYKGKTFFEVAGVNRSLIGSDSGESFLKDAFKAGPWIEEDDYEFNITGTADASIIARTIVGMSVETFHFIGIKANPSFVTIELPAIPKDTEYHVLFYEHNNLDPNPVFLNTFVSDSEQNLQVTHWINSTYDNLWNIIENSPAVEEILEASYQMQRILWQEQPKVVIYINDLNSMYRTDKFTNQITVPGMGAYGYWSMIKMHLKEGFKNNNNYQDWPLGGTLFYGLPQPMGSQNTWWDRNVSTLNVLQLIEEGLTMRHPQDLSWMKGGGLSEDHEVISPCITQDCISIGAENGTKVTWKIRQDVQWHDGDPLTTEDIAFSYQKLYETQAPSYSDDLKNFKGVEYNDTHVMVYSTSSGLFEFERLQIKVYKKAIWNNTPGNDPFNFLNSVPVGTGPYKWQSRTPGEFVVLTRNNDYYFDIVLDSDNDGMPDSFEHQFGLDPARDDGGLDKDGDGMSNLWEYQMGLDLSLDDGDLDKDNDGFPNLWEFQMGLDPTINDTILDKDNDGMSNLWEYQMGLNASFNDSYLDLDNDGLSNLQEYLYGSWANHTDTDLDGMTDYYEYSNGLDPIMNDRASDKDRDGISNYQEYLAGSQANNFFSVPIISLSVLHGFFTLMITLVNIIGYIYYSRKNLIRSLGAPNYATAQKMYKGYFTDYQTYKKAQQLGINSLEEYELFLEKKSSEEIKK
ncbi:MAG: ABC transporter substrate-binding protein [Candidatus Hodarchaeales archaeon]|jgi:ABC-type transport system substrate-binding protein